MQIDDATRQATAPDTEGGDRMSSSAVSGAEVGTAADGQTKAEGLRQMDAVVERHNLWRAYERVMRNKGAAGVDGLTVLEFKAWLQQHWPSVKAALLAGDYMPTAIRKVEIPKPNGGVRTLGIPTVLDRLIQQALLQVLQPEFEPEFSEHSYGFRPGRNAWQAVQRAQSYIREGRRWVVDLDLEKFFDRVNHDILMSRMARKVKDERVLKLVRRYLEAGMMSDGIVSARIEGTPQGGPLSPLLSNILLTDLDRELERRGHRFCRYADDCNIYVRSAAAGRRAMVAITDYLERKLKLQVNRGKSAVARPWERKFLGYSFTWHKQARLKIAGSSLKRLKDKVRDIVVGNASRNLGATINELNPVLRGWSSYFRLTEVKGALQDLDGWIRRKLRCLLWRQWKRPATRNKRLQTRGLDERRAWKSASNGRGPWWNAGASHMNAAYPKRAFDALGLVSLLDTQQRFQFVK
ncbi:group II intron reverse transcriptase/maturase [Janthinobacterium sp.]|uniref:group II intron reverse transcriptase/maturase n=1 Tax=Janthinobacterium sp. TaxID=1871054 RepID=UPI00293D4B57|nr:group II intron reverse transcriptase/maturase [Janthinobacterium sp.]